MSWVADAVRGLVEGFVEAVNKPPAAKPWRWGHAFLPTEDSNMCVYCKRFIPGKVRDTSIPCQGPSHKLTKAELGR